ncbi:substrate-binding domain-containing protein [Georgenia sp. Z1344]|uniref:substrate-binding domain-containing protein n=1 Tax=Georgenia sp. Z1344 TaxID=3416706 RepID=UPI003CEE54CF
MTRTTHRRRGQAVLSGLAVAALALTACSSDDAEAGGDGSTTYVTIITKDPDNHFWTAMVEGAEEAAADAGIELTVAAGADQSDADGQIQAIEDAIARGDSAILIANNGPAVNDAIERARDEGLLVLALDTPTDPVDAVDATLATDNFEAGQLIGQWAAGSLDGEQATIALINLFDDKIVSVDYQRGQGFLDGMGIDIADPETNGDESATGEYSAGEYEIVCNEASNGSEDGGRTAMENCLSLNPDINVVYTANETSGVGAVQALEAAGNTDALVVSLDGSCSGVDSVAAGEFGAVAQQYPFQMGLQGIEAVVQWLDDGTLPEPTEGSDFVNTGTALVTDEAVDGLDSIDTTEGSELCW